MSLGERADRAGLPEEVIFQRSLRVERESAQRGGEERVFWAKGTVCLA